MEKCRRAILVNVIPHDQDKTAAMAQFNELVHLVETYGGIVILKILQKRARPSAKTFLGEGKAKELAGLVKELKADLVIVNGFLKANQSNHLINIIPCEVLDRFEMILKIFEKHARTPESKLQLQVAQYKYEFPKLFGRGAILSQQAPGVSVSTSGASGRRAARGPGEKILEVKRRHLKQQIQMLEQKLQQFQRVRELQRDRRKRQNFSTIAIVGYTNSGKSSLMRALTKKENIVVEDKLFSTLDTRLGEMCVRNEGRPDARSESRLVRPETTSGKILLADTIGFMQNMPPLLFSSFLATLGEVKEANLLLHVIDSSDAQVFEKIKVVEDVLAQLGCSEKPRICVFNKIDICDPLDLSYLEYVYGDAPAIFVSALKRENTNRLLTEIQAKLMMAREPNAGPCSSTDRAQASGA